MNFIKSIAKTVIIYTVAGAANVIGMYVGSKLWDEKIAPAIDKKIHSNH